MTGNVGRVLYRSLSRRKMNGDIGITKYKRDQSIVTYNIQNIQREKLNE